MRDAEMVGSKLFANEGKVERSRLLALSAGGTSCQPL